MTASDRLASLDATPAVDLCATAEATLTELVDVMNRETTLLRAGLIKEAGTLTAHKARLSQEYVGLVRAMQRQMPRLRAEAPDAVERVKAGHERLATQMAENLKVLATARNVTEDLLADVARSVGAAEAPRTYGAGGAVSGGASAARGLSVNRAL